uniref:Uncharacterized protein n=1 Tax=Rhizophagus irregularis (strain DAOM 181602 / DAOM 197198 / MUCL 43194) TaxID=747089 RepID=U9TEJ4_RHIID
MHAFNSQDIYLKSLSSHIYSEYFKGYSDACIMCELIHLCVKICLSHRITNEHVSSDKVEILE